MLNKGVWMNENKVKQQIESIVPLEWLNQIKC
jgi:hypothetical protein